tara:strand:- start:275 stop:730 length:456 start_codon:yes stop_codon:yes gene_type:complete
MAWYDNVLQVDEFNVPYAALAFEANSIGIESMQSNPPRFDETKQFLKKCYDLGLEKRRGEQEYDDASELARSLADSQVPEDDFTRWLIFTDLRGWEVIEYVWKDAIEEAAEFDADDRGVIPYRVVEHFAEELIYAGLNANLYTKMIGGFAR